MNLSWIWEATLIFFIGTFILRIGGRKSISQMTISQTIVMIGLGSLLIQPVSGNGLLLTFAIAALLTLLMIITEYFALEFDFLETFFAGKALIVVEQGKVNLKNLRKIRLTIDKLETRLRQSGISSIEDVKYATIEVSGQLGYELKDQKKPLTREDLQPLLSELAEIKKHLGINPNNPQANNPNLPPSENIFKEMETNKYEGNENEP